MTDRRRVRTAVIAVACLILGIAVGFAIPRGPSTDSSEATRPESGSAPSRARNIYSPDIRNDDYVRQEQLKIVEMLERQCRLTGENCALAKSARQAMARD